jgi:hypothetical protein
MRVAFADTPLAGSAGTDTSLPNTDSAVTMAGRGKFTNLKIAVNQTKHLFNQAVSVTWTGGDATVFGTSSLVQGNFLQIFQCWGEDDGTNTLNPGPPPEQCEYGAPVPSQPAGAFVNSRIMALAGWPTYDPKLGYVDNNGTTPKLWMPFRSVDGTVTNAQTDELKQHLEGGGWLNKNFNASTSNEIQIGLTHNNGTGAELFAVDTGLEASGLGCGQKIEPLPDGSTRIPKCWLVIVPRGTPADENPPNFFSSDQPVQTSPLTPTAWANRIAIPLDFNPVDSSCAIGANERRMVGSELATAAVTNWQPKLCAAPGAPPYNFASISDRLARQQLTAGGTAGPGMAVMSRPIDPAAIDPANPVTYAPLTLSAITVGFNIERQPSTNGSTGKLNDPNEKALAGIRVAHINLTPRLVAKLLSESYREDFPRKAEQQPDHSWMAGNPSNLLADPDFLQFNTEFQNLQGAVGHAVVEQPTADAAYQVWKWVLADPEAATWLAGTPDPWKMKVNSVYNTNPGANPSGTAFANPVPDNYPASDPYCYASTDPSESVGTPPQQARPMCMTDTQPQANNMQVAAQEVRNASDGAKVNFDPNAVSGATAWVSLGQPPLFRSMVSVADSASAIRYGLQIASLSRAGDDAAARSFVAPDKTGMLAGTQAMVPSAEPAVLEPGLTSTAAGAYPLTMLTYAAATPRSLDQAARTDYADFIKYAVTDGQVPGLAFGQLLPGYTPLPANLVTQALAAASRIRAGDPAPPDSGPPSANPPSTPNATRSSSSNSQGGGAGAGGGGGAATGAGSDTGGGSTAGSSPVDSPITVVQPPKLAAVFPPPKSSGRTPWDSLGAIRYTLPIAIAVGIAAAIGAQLLIRRREQAAELVLPGGIDPVPDEST